MCVVRSTIQSREPKLQHTIAKSPHIAVNDVYRYVAPCGPVWVIEQVSHCPQVTYLRNVSVYWCHSFACSFSLTVSSIDRTRQRTNTDKDSPEVEDRIHILVSIFNIKTLLADTKARTRIGFVLLRLQDYSKSKSVFSSSNIIKRIIILDIIISVTSSVCDC